jgi:hypothetical protein
MPRKFAATIITEVEFVGGDSSDQFDENYLKHLTEELEKAANGLSLRSIKGLRVTFCAGGVMRPA